ncbi:Arc domain protein DNA binding domain rotein [Acinetobacter baumannii]|uniref:Arc family DNA-binding protein n=1 Tax=Acinetobacter baumannii TaxID=470 RepID=UPI000DE6BFBF|nr:Arc family DNA-binding protein [Acinetobacter baumannii]KAB1100062.1 Arc family DNA-binding protein [Acinetobacter baumannii]MCJ8918078.1 Arc family DNA-binding protein [Acinetobacter baumannii]MCJ8979967.1 Arc family DNA-binding protein [Acinetobacter baumannii]MCJ9284419.1 Arc family DNA-binding protein [Acinetobacter baumannii]MCJ9317118.1 Arc family DNA-binding protein [Acinetobacter baumannii]
MSEDVQFNLRIPAELKQQIVEAAKKNSRSINAEAQLRLEKTFELDNLPEPTSPKNINDPEKLEEWAQSILKELLKLNDLSDRIIELEEQIEYFERYQNEQDKRIDGLEGHY